MAETIDLSEQNIKSDRVQRSFARNNLDKKSHHLIDFDGLPHVGQRISLNDPYYSTYNESTSQATTIVSKVSEPAYVDYVAVDVKNKRHIQKYTKEGEKDIYKLARMRERKTLDIGKVKCVKDTDQKVLVQDKEIKERWRSYFDTVFNGHQEQDIGNLNIPSSMANIRLRHPRNPVIGDKFSSRHGQKGVCSQLWPDTDMPFSGVTGMRPDLIINPHAFPSRMTIGMLLESIAAKGGALHGNFVNATPFSSSMTKKSESDSTLVDELGSKLIARGFNYHGLEVLYSGVYGTEMTCEIFIGPVYYQRLRHMVSDKFQVRSTGKTDQVTRQPIKGRKRGGGVRFGEMERDSLLAHGAAYLLHDRLHTSSDYHIADVCSLCGSILTTSIIQSQKKAVRDMIGRNLPPIRAPKKVTCVSCKTSKGMETVAMPYVFRYLAAELAAMNIKMTLQLSNGAGA
ncbi:DNA-directed RNA polymerase I subunit RPA2 [Orobanche minor]